MNGIAKRTDETANIVARDERTNTPNKVVLMHARALTNVIECVLNLPATS